MGQPLGGTVSLWQRQIKHDKHKLVLKASGPTWSTKQAIQTSTERGCETLLQGAVPQGGGSKHFEH